MPEINEEGMPVRASNGLDSLPLDIDTLRGAYKEGLRPEDVIAEVYRRIKQDNVESVWTLLVEESDALMAVRQLDRGRMESLPLYGIPFSVKDNIHVQGLSTSAGCAAFEHHPECSAQAVKQALEAGAILIGKNTMDEFATGLVGIRSTPHPVNAFDSDYIPGGSSSGSAVAVSRGFVSFALATDTGGSGRVPAALNNIVGLKSTPGYISNEGLVYAHRSFDCVPVFALSCADADIVFNEIKSELSTGMGNVTEAGFHERRLQSGVKVGVPSIDQMQFFGDELSAEKYRETVDAVKKLGWGIVEIDFEPFLQAGKLLFGSSLVAERYASIGEFVESSPEFVNTAVRQVISRAHDYSAVDVFNDLARLQEYREAAYSEFDKMDLLMVPTAGTIYTIDEVKKDPINLNNNMGFYTYFANLLRLPAITVPSGLRRDNLPFGVSFLALPGHDEFLIDAVKKFEVHVDKPTGAFMSGCQHQAHADGSRL